MDKKKILQKNIGMISLVALYMKLLSIQSFKQRNFDITPEQFFILSIVSGNEGLYQRQLSQIIAKDRANTTRIINILEKHKLLERKLDPDNKRICKIFITDKGRKTVKIILPEIEKIKETIYEGITLEEKESITKILSKILDNLDSKVKIQT